MTKNYLPFLIYLAVVPLIHLTTRLTGTPFYLTQLTMSAYYGLVVLGLALLMGYAGQISLGHAAFFSMGGYCTAVLCTWNLLPWEHTTAVHLIQKMGLTYPLADLYGEPRLLLSPWVSFLLSISLAGGVAALIGKPVLKLKGHYLAMATLGFGTIVYRLFLGSSLCGAADGLSNIPPFRLLPWLTVTSRSVFRVENYYIAWGLVGLGLLLLQNLMTTRTGRALRAIHGNEVAAEAMGIDTAGFKVKVFIISAVYASAAGVFMTHYSGGIGPSEASVMKSVRYVAIVAAGGMGSLWGTLLLSVVLNFLSLRGVFGTFDDAVFGGILILIMLFAPQGILSRETWKFRFRSKQGKKHGTP